MSAKKKGFKEHKCSQNLVSRIPKMIMDMKKISGNRIDSKRNLFKNAVLQCKTCPCIICGSDHLSRMFNFRISQIKCKKTKSAPNLQCDTPV